MAEAHDTTGEPQEAQPPIVIKDTSLATLAELAPAVGRYFVAIVTLAPIVWKLLRVLDIDGLMTFWQGGQGKLLAQSAVGLATIGYGLYRMWVKRRRGIVTATAASDDVAIVV